MTRDNSQLTPSIRASAAARWTLAERAEFRTEIQRSQFLAIAERLTSAEDWQERLAALADPAASHCCWAWKYSQQYRSSDDGEPAGSAGRPILAAINGQALDQVLVVVLRWFGGIKLGIGGLARAYGGSAAECLRRAPRIELVDLLDLQLLCSFESVDVIRRLLGALGGRVRHSEYSSVNVILSVRVPGNKLHALRSELANATRGRAQLTPTAG